jgi:hypothetical protein
LYAENEAILFFMPEYWSTTDFWQWQVLVLADDDDDDDLGFRVLQLQNCSG